MLRRLLLVGLVLGAGAATAADAQVRVDLNVPAHRLTVYDGAEKIATYPIAVGMPGHDTPIGTYEISHAEWNPWWYPPTHREWARHERPTPPGPDNPMGAVKLYFLPMYFIHGTPAGESIGTPASRGCVRMLNDDAVELATLLHSHAAPEVTAEEIARIRSRPGSTRRVNFDDTIEVTIRYDQVVVEGREIFVYPDIYGYNSLHTESVYQALLRAGYDVSEVDPAEVRRFIADARGERAPVVARLADVFSGELALAGS